MMQIVMEGASVERGGDGPSTGLLQEALALCSNACSKVRIFCNVMFHTLDRSDRSDPHLMV